MERRGPSLLESMPQRPSYEIVAGTSNPELAKSIGEILHRTVDGSAGEFLNHETKVQITPNLRKRDVFVINSMQDPANNYFMELLTMVQAAKLASAAEVTAVIPYYGYGRQDKKDAPHVPITADLVAKALVNAGADRIFTLDIHAEQTMGSIAPRPWDNLYGSRVLLPAVSALGLDNPVVASADAGGVKKAEKFSLLLDGSGEVVMVHKRRSGADVKAKAVVGDVEGRDVIMVDDMIDTAGTLREASQLIKAHGANRIIALATHGQFTGPALDRISDSPIDRVLVTDTIRQSDEVRNNPKIQIVTVAALIAEAIKRIHRGGSLSALIPMPPKS